MKKKSIISAEVSIDGCKTWDVASTNPRMAMPKDPMHWNLTQ